MKSLAKRLLIRNGLYVQRYPGVRTLEGLTLLIVDHYNVDLILDVGANVGQYGRRLREGGYRGRIASVEPLTDAFEQLRVAAAGDPLWTVHQRGLGATSGEMPLNVATDTSVSSFLTPNPAYIARYQPGDIVRREPVEVSRLDEVFQEVAGDARRVLLKCDTQGYDLEVIRGAAGVLDRIVAIQSELSVRPIYHGMVRYLDALREIETLGFTPSGLFPVDVDSQLRAVELDGLFVREDLRSPGSIPL